MSPTIQAITGPGRTQDVMASKGYAQVLSSGPVPFISKNPTRAGQTADIPSARRAGLKRFRIGIIDKTHRGNSILLWEYVDAPNAAAAHKAVSKSLSGRVFAGCRVGLTKAFPVAAALALAVLLGGCSDVQMSAAYSSELDQVSVATDEAAARAAVGRLTPDQAAAALAAESRLLHDLRDARDGKAATQPSGQ